MSNAQTFIAQCLRGQRFLWEVDDFVDAWHDAGGAPNGNPQPLSEYLGMTAKEYKLWVEKPESLRLIVAGRKTPRPISDLQYAGAVAAAARAEGSSEAAEVVKWLIQTGQIDDPGGEPR